MNPVATCVSAMPVAAADRGLGSKVKDYWTLTKPEVNTLVVMSTLCGFYLGSRGPMNPLKMFHTLLGTLLVASGTATLNQLMERAHDARMRRTANRPLPSGRIKTSHALWFGLLLSLGGVLYLALAVNLLSSDLALLTLASYLLLYTPLKRKSPLCTLVGAFPGAMPPLIGWAAASGVLTREAWILFAILFLWQFPHFLAIAWMYREDYARAGFKMLPAADLNGRFTGLQVIATTFGLLSVSLLPVFLGEQGTIYFIGALVTGMIFLFFGARLGSSMTNSRARQVLFASILYLPIIFGLMMLDKLSGRPLLSIF